jgi:hypothetical protein
MNIRNFRRERPGDTFRGWLYTITRNKIRDYRRKWPGDLQGAGGTDAQRRLAQQPDSLLPEQPDDGDAGEQIALTRRAILTLRPCYAPSTWAAFWRTTIQRESPADVAAATATAGALFHLEMIARGHYLARRGMINLSLPMTEADLEALVAALDDFLAVYGAVLSAV